MPSSRLSETVSAPVLFLVQQAAVGNLAICAGAGVSFGASLPSGTELAEKLHQRFDGSVTGYVCNAPDNLVKVSTAAAELPGGLEALQRVIVDLAPFDRAEPTLAHLLLGLLVSEGAIQLITTNWDDCIERGSEERLQAARDANEAEDLQQPYILKIHGCCTRPSTLLVTEPQLTEPPLWTSSAMGAAIATSTMVFVGIGDVAPYVRVYIERLAKYVNGARVRVVSPGIVSNWDSSLWSSILPDLTEDRRLALSADDFLDELARGWVNQLIVRLATDQGDACVLGCSAAFQSQTALQSLVWLRGSKTDWPVGKSIVRSAEALAALKSVVSICSKRRANINSPIGMPTVRFEGRGSVRIDDERIEVLIGPSNRPAAELERAARSRAEKIANERGDNEVTVLCSATMIEGKRRKRLDLIDILETDSSNSDDPSDDLITGPGHVPVSIVWADDLLREVA